MEGRIKSKYILETMAEGRKARGALGKAPDEIDEIVQVKMSKKVW
jgi:hypothetical protein